MPRRLLRVRTARYARLLMSGICIAVLAACDAASDNRSDLPTPLFVNAASQDRALFLTWNVVPEARRTTLHCQRITSDEVHRAAGDAGGWHLLSGLVNDQPYECHGERELTNGQVIRSQPVRQTPRSRQQQAKSPYLTSQQSADAHIKASGFKPGTLSLRGRPQSTFDALADGAYTGPEGGLQFLLLRQVDKTFQAPDPPRAPGEVREVLKRALWPRWNPFDHSARFPMPVSPIEPAAVGQVREFASASSFVVAYHPQLSSRCTGFVPPGPASGKVAIYIDGHATQTVEKAAGTIMALLQRGWQVIAVDMPLIGANAVDRTATLIDHNSFYSWPSDDFSPVALFLQPLKAVVDEIYRTQAPGVEPTIMLIGKSGGGWTSFMYGALDPRIDYAVAIAGGMPMSQWLQDAPRRAADYEQVDPLIYGAVRYEDIMPAAGSRGAFFVYNKHDSCCFRLDDDDPFVRYLRAASVALRKPIGVYIDHKTRTHSFSDTALAALGAFVEKVESEAH